MPKLNHRMIRLGASVICSSVAIAFMIYYTATEVSYLSYLSDEHGINIGVRNGFMFFMDYGRWGYAVPLICLVIGSWLIIKRPRSLVAFELLIFGFWLFTILFVGYSFLACQIENEDLSFKELSLIQAGKK